MIVHSPIANAGSDALTCQEVPFTVTTASAQYFNSVLWTTTGTGILTNENTLSPTYTPAPLETGNITLTLTVTGNPPCDLASDFMILSITAAPTAYAGSDTTTCQGEPFTVTQATSSNASYIFWTHNGNGTLLNPTMLTPTYIPAAGETGDVTLTISAYGFLPCPTTSDSMILSITPDATVSAGPDISICEVVPVHLLGSDASNYSSLQWSTSGTGIFDDATILHPHYTPSQDDVNNGFVLLWLTANSLSSCPSLTDTMRLSILQQPVASAGQDTVICNNDPFSVTGASTTNADSILWTHNGLGNLIGETSITPVYIPDPGESGIVILTLTATGSPPCGSASDELSLTINKQAIANAGTDDTICENQSYTLSEASAQNFLSVIWTTSGTGSFNAFNILNPVYFPSQDDILTGQVTLTLMAYGEQSCENVSDSMTLYFIPIPTAYAGPDLRTCPGAPVQITGASAQNYSSFYWTHSGLGSLANDTTLSPVYTPASLEQGAVILTLSLRGYGQCSDTTIQTFMTITIEPIIFVDAGPSQSIPNGTSTMLEGEVNGGSGTFMFQWQPTPLVLEYTSLNPETVILTESVTFYLTATDVNTGCKATDSVRINIGSHNEPPVAVDDYDSTIINVPIQINILRNDYDPDGFIASVSHCGGPSNGMVLFNNDSTITYTPNTGFTGLDSLCYLICDNGTPVLCDTATVYILVSDESPFNWIVIYNVITPNGDGDNDLWIIDGIDRFPNNAVVIFNRWGDKINSYERYDNKTVVWDGTDLRGHSVPDGTYFFLLTINDAGTKKGWIFVRKGRK
jgi:gliding motility-associated-like protein